MRLLVALLSTWFAANFARADRVTDLTRIHAETMGGNVRIAALNSLRATGRVVSGAKQVRFTMTAARPNRVRMETEGGGRTLVQGTNGVDPAWEFDTGTSAKKPRTMADRTAKTFLADAEFDDPLIGGPARGYRVDFAGETDVNGRKHFRLLVTHRLHEPFSVLLDASTYLITLRLEQRTTAIGRPVSIMTRYADFRPVDGVLLPHEITTSIDGKITQQTIIDLMEGNPPLAVDLFSLPNTGRSASAHR